MSTDNPTGAMPNDPAAADWESVDGRAETATEVHAAADQVSPASFANFAPTTGSTAGNDINMILDIPVQLTVELGRTRIPIKNILQLAQGSVVELEAMAGEPMDDRQRLPDRAGGVVVVNEKFRSITDIVTPSELWRLSRADRPTLSCPSSF